MGERHSPLQVARVSHPPLDMGSILHFSRSPGGNPFSKQ